MNIPRDNPTASQLRIHGGRKVNAPDATASHLRDLPGQGHAPQGPNATSSHLNDLNPLPTPNPQVEVKGAP
jgi:hypothetical protein